MSDRDALVDAIGQLTRAAAVLARSKRRHRRRRPGRRPGLAVDHMDAADVGGGARQSHRVGASTQARAQSRGRSGHDVRVAR
jgi:hypothetical protein